jgi:response regulator RpfG family c-di-GMP phosphodiesterase
VLLDISMDDMDGWETARRIRARGIGANVMPIIMVSANAFENRPEKLAEAGAQAFVDKPVIESELLVALQRHLELEWVAELPQPEWRIAPKTLEPGPLPPEFAATLTRLARLGHAQGLLLALDQLVQSHPAHAAQAAALRTLAERFAFDELLERLAPSRAGVDIGGVEAP